MLLKLEIWATGTLSTGSCLVRQLDSNVDGIIDYYLRGAMKMNRGPLGRAPEGFELCW